MQMGTFFRLFDCESRGANHNYEERFRWFTITRGSDGKPQVFPQVRLEKLIADALRATSDDTAVIPLARLLGFSLDRDAYGLFIDDIGWTIALAVFYDESAVNADGFTDFDGTKDANFSKYRFFKFASFLDLLQPGYIRWRPQTELESEKLVTLGLRRFLQEGLQGRSAILLRWIEQPGLSAFSERKAKQSKEMHQRRAFLRKLPHNLAAAMGAKRLDDAGIKPGKRKTSYASFKEWHRANPNSFHAWLSRQRR
jgi:hypothetical protein